MSGHIIGYYMATIILKKFGRDMLTSLIGTPYAFMLQYTKAAEDFSTTYPLSMDSMNLIYSLLKRYKNSN